jgi:hypothetical protein
VSLIVLVSPLVLIGTTHGHGTVPLDITVRLVDRETGQALEGGLLVATVRSRAVLELDSFDVILEETLKAAPTSRGSRFNPSVARTSGQSETIVPSVAYTTVWHVFGIRAQREYTIPGVLMVDHPLHGRTFIDLERETTVDTGTEPWRLDLGTIRVP